MHAAIDQGNTAIKVGLFEGSILKEVKTALSLEGLGPYLASQGVKEVAVCSVGVGKADLLDTLAGLGLHTYTMEKMESLPIRNGYGSPETLGPDRLAAVIGARVLFPEQACLVVDLGSCLTFDYVTAEGVYIGGGISPGLAMRFRAMHTFTASLPLPAWVQGNQAMEQWPELVGNDTISCLASGVLNGMVAELNGVLAEYIGKFGEMKVILCGGNARLFESKMKLPIFVNESLVLLGLNAVLLKHVEQKKYMADSVAG